MPVLSFSSTCHVLFNAMTQQQLHTLLPPPK